MQTTIAIDAMGGDHGPSVTIPAALKFLAKSIDRRVIVVGKRDVIEMELKRARDGHIPGSDVVRLCILEASDVVGMDEDIRSAIRNKKNSSMRVAIDLVKSGEAHACVSAGNTGALMGTAKFVLKTLPGIDRPAICAALPTRHGVVYALDLGANAASTPEHLLQFAIMGAMLCTAVEGKQNPSVGLLNIGSEDIKGNDSVKAAGELLKASHLNFYGNVEGTDIYKGTTDVVVCDGFVGNVMLKTSEGMAKMMGDFLKAEYENGIYSKLAAVVSLPVIKRFRHRMDHRRYNGAALLGLKGVVVKSHGSADTVSFSHALDRAASEVEHGLLALISTEIERLHSDGLLAPRARNDMSASAAGSQQ